MAEPELREYVPTVGVALDQAEVVALQAAKVRVSPSIAGPARYDLVPQSMVGVVRIGDRQFVIQPKVGVTRFMFMLGYSLGTASFESRDAALDSAGSVYESIIPGFAFQVEKALERGVLQGYRTVDEALLTVRGRLRISDQVAKRFGVAPPIEVSYDDFTEDIDENRVVKAALNALHRLPARSTSLRHRLRRIAGGLSNVSDVPYTSRAIPRITFTRLNRRYEPAVSLARLILSSTSFDLGTGTVPSSAFLIDMNKLFEDFILVGLRDATGLSTANLVQGANGHDLHLDAGRQIALEPDISVWEGGRCLAVGDVKYKRLSLQGFKHPDMYQMLAYMIGTGLRRGMLIYPSDEAASGEFQIMVHGEEYVIEVAPIELLCAPAELQAQLRALGQRILEPTVLAAA